MDVSIHGYRTVGFLQESNGLTDQTADLKKSEQEEPLVFPIQQQLEHRLLETFQQNVSRISFQMGACSYPMYLDMYDPMDSAQFH
jgi:hypothetical protein